MRRSGLLAAALLLAGTAGCGSGAPVRGPRDVLPWRDLPSAEAEVERALAESPDDGRLWAAWAGLASRRRQWAACLSRCERALTHVPGLREALLYRGAARLATGDATGAEEDLARAAKGTADAPPARAAERLLRIARARRAGPGLVRATRHEAAFGSVTTDLGSAHALAVAAMIEALGGDVARTLGVSRAGEAPALTVVSFARREEFARYAGALLDEETLPEMALGVYVAPTRDLLLVGSGEPDRLRRVLRHEATHEFVDGFVAEPAPWFSEGLADFFAAEGRHPERTDGLRRAALRCDGPRLVALFAADAAQFLGEGQATLAGRAEAAGDNYSLAYAAVDRLGCAQPERLRAAFAALVAGRPPEAVAAAALGGDFPEAFAAEVRVHAGHLLDAANR